MASGGLGKFDMQAFETETAIAAERYGYRLLEIVSKLALAPSGEAIPQELACHLR